MYGVAYAIHAHEIMQIAPSLHSNDWKKSATSSKLAGGTKYKNRLRFQNINKTQVEKSLKFLF